MRNYKMSFLFLLLSILIAGIGGCDGCDRNGAVAPAGSVTPIVPTVSSTNPANGDTGVLINRKMATTFSVAMDPATITTENYLVTGPGATAVTGTVAYDSVSQVATFTPDSDLAVSTEYTATITTGVAEISGNTMISDYVWTFTTGDAADTTVPTVSSTNPANADTAVATNKKIAATFSEAMDPLTLTTAGNFTVTGPGTTAVTGTVVYDLVSNVAIYTPDSNLAPNTTFTATITTAATDLAGNAVASNKVWTFTTGDSPDTTAPTVSLTDPAAADTNVATNKKIAATFSEAMDALTLTTVGNFTVTGPGTTPVTGTVAYNLISNVATFTPDADLASSTVFTATITSAVKDLAGNALVNNVWTFTTGAMPDLIAPAVSSTNPADADIDVALNSNVTANFSENMDTSTITGTTFTLKQGGALVLGALTFPNLMTAVFNPDSDLADGLVYTAELTTGVKDLAGNALTLAKTWSFTTVTTVPLGPPVVDLHSISTNNFVILSSSPTTGITDTGSQSSAITGNIGLSPASAAAIHVWCSEMTGFIYGADVAYTGDGVDVACFKGAAADNTTVSNAVLDMGIAYTQASAPATPAATDAAHLNVGAGTLNGQNFAPGTYTWDTPGDVHLTGDITLTGGAKDVWIFQMSGDLNVDSKGTLPLGVKVILAPGVKASNVFWQVGGGTGATLGTYSTFNGIILTAKQVIMQTGAVLHGRALAQTAVVLDANPVGP